MLVLVAQSGGDTYKSLLKAQVVHDAVPETSLVVIEALKPLPPTIWCW
jgi:hypothetical protein